jgi:RNA polymerase sigma-70 factor (ECF subfamily)
VQRVPDGLGDEELVAAVADGDRGALGRLYDRYAPVLLAVTQQVVGSRREAEDLVHDVFLEAWRHADEYDPARGSVRTWLVMRARSRALDRRRSAGFSRVRPLEDEPARGDETVPLEDPLLAPDRTAVRRALEALPPDQRAVLELGYFEGLSSSEMAERLATPIGTIKSRVAAALAKLRSGFSESA